MKTEKIVLENGTGLHARPASELAKLSNKFGCNIEIVTSEKRINAKSVLAIMSAGIKTGTELEIVCEGEDEEKAMSEIIEAFNNNFGE